MWANPDAGNKFTEHLYSFTLYIAQDLDRLFFFRIEFIDAAIVSAFIGWRVMILHSSYCVNVGLALVIKQAVFVDLSFMSLEICFKQL